MLKRKPINMNSKRSINLLVETMLRLMKDKSFGAITISELTREAGVVRNTFYAHFDTKEDILTYYMYQIFRDRVSLILEKTSLDDFDFDILYFQIWEENLEFLKLLKDNCLLGLLNNLTEQFELLSDEFDIYKDCIVSDISKDYVMALYTDSLASVVRRWMKMGCKEPASQLSVIFKEFMKC